MFYSILNTSLGKNVLVPTGHPASLLLFLKRQVNEYNSIFSAFIFAAGCCEIFNTFFIFYSLTSDVTVVLGKIHFQNQSDAFTISE